MRTCPALHHLIWVDEGADKTDGWHRMGWFTVWNHGETFLKLVREKEAWHLTEPCKNCSIQTKFSLILTVIFQMYWSYDYNFKIISRIYLFPNALYAFQQNEFIVSGSVRTILKATLSPWFFVLFRTYWIPPLPSFMWSLAFLHNLPECQLTDFFTSYGNNQPQPTL